MKKLSNILLASLFMLVFSVSSVSAGGNIEDGKEKSAVCASCHGFDGISPAAIYPHIGGQYADYLLHSLRGYKSGERQNIIMQGMVMALSDDDLKDLAAYYASLPGVLKEGAPKP
jgi:cytochrome c553